MSETPFSSIAAFRDTFVSGLSRLLQEYDGLGPFVLVLNNAAFDPAVQRVLHAALAERFSVLAERCRRTLIAGRDPDEPEDDLAVFLRLMAIGFDRIAPVTQRSCGPWELQFNLVRALRPKRAAQHAASGLRKPFDPAAFNFNKPFLRKEIFWSGALAGWQVDLFYNKFPFVDCHALLVPDRTAQVPQFLEHAYHEYVWGLADELGRYLPGLVIAYNSYGAYASVNHLHFQMSIRERALPIAAPGWAHNGGYHSYPSVCQVSTDSTAAWRAIQGCHDGDMAYNLIYEPGRMFFLPRRRQGTYSIPDWCGGQAWYEMAGGAVAFSADDYERLTVDQIEQMIASASLLGMK